MRYLRNCLVLLAIASLFLFLSTPAMAQPRPMPEDVFTPLAMGYDLMREGKYDAAEFKFKTALERDRYNPFALNNLAAIAAQKGKLKEALAFLTDAQTHAKEYFDKYEQVCFTEGLCTGVKPLRNVGTESAIAKIIQENMAKLKAKIAATPEKPQPSTPPPMEEKKK
jgi:tetratricopeptide (TPR) repeat protein